MYTTIKISFDLKKKLDAMKIVDGETYEELLSDLLEDHLAINEKTRKRLAKAMAGYRKGEVVSLEELKKKAKFNV
jgi:hypothetical protein